MVVANAASAQEFLIRANRGLNLRAKPSLSAEIAGTVSTGVILKVVGASGRWLEINRNGSQAWLANWVNYTRVEDGAAIAPEINNCCFVDRQCATDQEWIAGYWAFQNKQCPAPSRSQPQTRAEASAQVQIDNCCFVDRECKSDEEWTAGYWAFQHGHCPAPGGVNHSISRSRALPSIEGPAAFIRRVKRALDLIYEAAPEWHSFVVNGSDRIIYNDDLQAVAVAVSPARRIEISRSAAFFGSETSWSRMLQLGMILVHESCHIHRSDAGLVSGGKEGESDCIQKEIEFLGAVDPDERSEILTGEKHERRYILHRIRTSQIPGLN